LGDVGVVREGSLTFNISKYAISVDMEQWTVEHRDFAVDIFFKTGDSVTLTQLRFRVCFNVGRHGKLASRNTTGSALKKKPPGGAQTIRTPENVEIVRWEVATTPRRSATKHGIALGISDRSVRRILHLDFYSHSYKMMVVQELHRRDWANRVAFAQKLEIMVDDAAIGMSDEAYLHLSWHVNK
jgi:hypothetical protein